ncbi:uncharacterized protein LOC133815592 [Humulus lupulus]|uniref:uncharacterized protein LOC133815592 n=1 Tax=Humulus lupulus TaxID=3486 RepID=UPI002B4096DB|nr:uncharacterized protein LOC133815592 [Humulus lupulus]
MCYQIILSSWASCDNSLLSAKIDRVSAILVSWRKEITWSFKARLRRCKATISRLKHIRDDSAITQYLAAQTEMCNILHQQEIFWHQRSKHLWLKDGDQNTKYFHAVASTQRLQNMIHRLQEIGGSWVYWINGLDSVIVNYFKQLFSSKGSQYAEILDSIPSVLTESHNNDLLHPVSDTEVKKAVFQMHPEKAPGPDVLTPTFY